MFLKSLFKKRKKAVDTDAAAAAEFGTIDETAETGFVCIATNDTGKQGLVNIRLDGKVELLVESLASEKISSFAVSPDRKWLVYTCHVYRERLGAIAPQLKAISLLSGKKSELTSWDEQYQPFYFNPRFSPTGDKLVCSHSLQTESNPDLLTFNLDEFGGTLYASRGDHIINSMRIGNHSAVFFEDGVRLAYFGNYAYEDLLEVCVFDPASAETEMFSFVGQRITQNAHGVWRRPRALAIQQDWEQIFFISGHGQSTERIGALTLSTELCPGRVASFQLISNEWEYIGGLDISRNGKLLVFEADGAIYTMKTDGDETKKILTDTEVLGGPFFMNNNNEIAVAKFDSIIIVNPNGEELTHFDISGWKIHDMVW